MKPVIIIDANALHGLKAFTKPHFKTVLALARTNHVRLVIPEVVLHELSRQGSKEFNGKHSTLRNAVQGFNDVISDAGAIGVTVAPAVAASTAPPPTSRPEFFDAMTAFLHSRKAETPAYPEMSVEELLARDLDYRKPFSESGKGFRDALIWATIRNVCNSLTAPGVAVIFVTKNYTDFCVGQGKSLHSHLRDEIAPEQPFDVVEDLAGLLEHAEIKPLTESLQVLDQTFTQKRLEGLVDDALSDLGGHDLEGSIGVYEGDGFTSIPIDSELSDTAFDEIIPDNETIEHNVFLTGDADEMTIRVTVDADCSIEGFIDKVDYFAHGTGFTYLEDWNSHTMRASEPHRIRFTLSADFTKATLKDVQLSVDEAEEVAL